VDAPEVNGANAGKWRWRQQHRRIVHIAARPRQIARPPTEDILTLPARSQDNRRLETSLGEYDQGFLAEWWSVIERPKVSVGMHTRQCLLPNFFKSVLATAIRHHAETYSTGELPM
jgi:hypothetical protein